MAKYTEKDLKYAFEYGVGLVCGRHSLKFSKADINTSFKDIKRWILKYKSIREK